MRKNLLMLSPVLCCSAQAQQLKPSNIIVNSLAILIQQCRAHTSQSFFVRISSDSCNKTYCSLYPLTFSGNTKACLDVLFSCSNDLGSCQTEIIPHYSQKSSFCWHLKKLLPQKPKRKCLPRLIYCIWDHITVVRGCWAWSCVWSLSFNIHISGLLLVEQQN